MSKYISPECKLIKLHIENIMATSGFEKDERYRCDKDCKIYHICRDRNLWGFCADKQPF